MADATTVTETIVPIVPIAPAPVQRQVGFITKGGGMDTDAWIALERAKNPNIIVKDFPDRVEFCLEEKKK